MQSSSSILQEDLVVSVHNQTGFVSLFVVDQGKIGVVLRNGRVSRLCEAGLKLMIRLPYQKLETSLVETRVRSLPIISQGEFLTVDHWRVNVSLLVSYKVINPARVVVDHAQPVQALQGMIKDLLGQKINQENFHRLSQQGRQILRQQLLGASSEVEEGLGIALVDARVDDLTLPEQVGAAFDQRRIAEMQGEAEQWRLRGKWQDMPAAVQRQHLRGQLAGRAMFVNSSIANMVLESAAPDPLIAGRDTTHGSLAATRSDPGEAWGQLTIVSDTDRGRTFTLHSSQMTIGRSQNNDIALADSSISSRHARIEQPGLIKDLDSTNGTFVNGHRIRASQLRGGETIRLGDTDLRFDNRSK